MSKNRIERAEVGGGGRVTPSVGRPGGGLWWAAGTAVISGVAIYVNRFGVQAWNESGGPLAYTTTKNVLAAVVLIGLLMRTAHRSFLESARMHWRGLLAVAVVGGGIPFVLFFEGLARASSTQAALLHKSLVLWVPALAIPLLGERIRSVHVLAIGLLFGGQIALVGGVGGVGFGSGEMMILIATLMWSVEVIVAKRILGDVDPIHVGVARMAGGAVVLLLIGLATGGTIAFGTLGVTQIGWAAMTGLLLAGYVFTWLTALSKAPATDVTAVLVGSVLITALLDLGPVGVVATPGLVAVGAGIAMLLVSARAVRVHV